MGFYKRSDDDIIPNHFEPFQKKNVDTIIAYKLSNEKNFFFLKGMLIQTGQMYSL